MDDVRPQPVFLGLAAKRITPTPGPRGGWFPDNVIEICSVSGCIASRPEGWLEGSDHNRGWCWDAEESALSHIPHGEEGRYALYAYRAIPRVFGRTDEPAEDTLAGLLWADWPPLPSEPNLSSYERLGYDVVGHDRVYVIAD